MAASYGPLALPPVAGILGVSPGADAMFATLLSAALSQTPAKPAEVYPGRAMIDAYFARQVKQISDACLTDLTTKENWEKRRPEMRRQFLEMMGLWPMPERTDLKATVTGTVEGDGYVVEKLHFQSRPGLYVTANLYKPKDAGTKKHPTILYVCGHGNVVENGVSYGSKVSYQYHPAWFATHGYVCLILDTLELGEIKGEHHGTHRLNQWWWQSRGYTPGGVELWNAIRALDYLETRPEVDAKKIGVTGRSGGGATSWWVAAADDRPTAIAPVAGIADLESHLCKGYTDRLKAGVIAGHCDCMFMVNTYRWDFAQVAALAAPRPLLLGNSDADDIFPVPGYRSIAAKVRKVYDLYGRADDFELLETKGPHKDTSELRIGINRFMNKWLKGDTTTKVEDDLPPKLPAAALKVFAELPKDSINGRIEETFVPVVKPAEIPADKVAAKAWWEKEKVRLKEELKAKCFGGWPKDETPAKLVLKTDDVVGEWRVRSFDFESEPGITLRLVYIAAREKRPTTTHAHVLDDNRANAWAVRFASPLAEKILGPGAKTVGTAADLGLGANDFEKAIVLIFPRGIGPTKWAATGSTDDTHIRRRFPLLGQTIEGQRVWDVRAAIRALDANAELRTEKVQQLLGYGDTAPVALAVAAFDPRVMLMAYTERSLDREPLLPFLNASRVLDLPRFMNLGPFLSFSRHDGDTKKWKDIIDFANASGVRPPIGGWPKPPE
jgi:dienelactone hydrolase